MELDVVVALSLSVITFAYTLHYRQKENLIRDIQNTISECRKLNNFEEQNGEEELEDRILCYNNENSLHRFSSFKLVLLRKKTEKFRDALIEVL